MTMLPPILIKLTTITTHPVDQSIKIYYHSQATYIFYVFNVAYTHILRI